VLLFVMNCTSYKPIEVGDVGDYQTIRVTVVDEGQETLREPRIEADSIVGIAKRGRPRPRDERRSFAIDEVSRVESRGTDVVGTVVLAVVAAGIALAIIAINSYEWCMLSC